MKPEQIEKELAKSGEEYKRTFGVEAPFRYLRQCGYSVPEIVAMFREAIRKGEEIFESLARSGGGVSLYR